MADEQENALEYSQSLAEQAAIAALPTDVTQQAVPDGSAMATNSTSGLEAGLLPTVTLDGVAVVNGVNGLHAVPPLQPFAASPGLGSPTIPTIQISLDATPSNSQMESIPLDAASSAVIDAFAPAPISTANPTTSSSVVNDPTPAQDNVAEPADPIAAGVTPWKAHNIDLQEVFTKFHRGKYYTPQDLLDDMLKIEENSKMVGNVDEICKLGDMVVQLKMWIGDFEPRWAPEFERLKVRMMEKKEERRRVRASQAKAAVGAGDGGVDGVANGEAIIAGDDVPGTGSAAIPGAENSGDTNDSQTGAKRPREDEEDRGSAKRAREEGTEVDPASNFDVQADSAQTTSRTEAGTAEATIPPPSYPPLVIPASLSTLAAELRHKTGGLNVDQLEQVRAGCFDLLWRKRGMWDRTEVVEEAREWVEGFLYEVKEIESD